MALDTTYTSPTYNAYSSIATMDDAMAVIGVLINNTFWSALSDTVKESLIKLATRDINKYEWIGLQNPSIVVASMDWPRTDIDNVLTTEIPYDVIQRMACWISHNAKESTLGATGSVNSKSVGEVSISYNATTAGSISQLDSCSDYASEYLDKSVYSSIGGIGSVSKRRGPA